MYDIKSYILFGYFCIYILTMVIVTLNILLTHLQLEFFNYVYRYIFYLFITYSVCIIGFIIYLRYKAISLYTPLDTEDNELIEIETRIDHREDQEEIQIDGQSWIQEDIQEQTKQEEKQEQTKQEDRQEETKPTFPLWRVTVTTDHVTVPETDHEAREEEKYQYLQPHRPYFNRPKPIPLNLKR